MKRTPFEPKKRGIGKREIFLRAKTQLDSLILPSHLSFILDKVFKALYTQTQEILTPQVYQLAERWSVVALTAMQLKKVKVVLLEAMRLFVPPSAHSPAILKHKATLDGIMACYEVLAEVQHNGSKDAKKGQLLAELQVPKPRPTPEDCEDTS